MISRSALLIFFLAALSAFPPFSTDIYLASMPIIQKLFVTSDVMVQLTLSLFFVGFSLGQLFWGPLSDRIGRKPVLWLGVSIYVVASFLCSWSHSILFLIVMRLVQSLGAAAGTVISLAIVRDKFSSDRFTNVISIMISVLMIAPLIAPVVGSYLLVHIGWEANFYFLAAFGLLLLLGLCFFKESCPPNKREPLPMYRLFSAYCEQLRNRHFVLAVGINAAIFCVMFSFIASSSFIYQRIYHVSPQHFGYYFAFNALGLILGSMTLNVFGTRFRSSMSLTWIGILLSLVSGFVMLAMVSFFKTNVWSVMIPMFVATYGAGLSMPSSTSLALSNVVQYSGLASALLGCIRFLSAAGVSALMGLIVHSTALPLAVMMIVLSASALMLAWAYPE